MNKYTGKLWELLNDLEDIVDGGYKTDHPRMPVAAARPAGSAVARPPMRTATAPAEIDQPRTQGAGALSIAESLKQLEEEVRNCRLCGLGLERTNAVPGMGPLNPKVFVIGEGPGAEEDRSGLPFVGPAGKYLDKWLSAIGMSRKTDTYIGNIVKCRPPGNRDPRPEESSTCLPFLMRQIEMLRPKAILTVGRIAAQVLLNSTRGIGAMRGKVYLFHDIPLVATYHPSGVLRNPGYRQGVWDDLRLLKNVLDGEESPVD